MGVPYLIDQRAADQLGRLLGRRGGVTFDHRPRAAGGGGGGADAGAELPPAAAFVQNLAVSAGFTAVANLDLYNTALSFHLYVWFEGPVGTELSAGTDAGVGSTVYGGFAVAGQKQTPGFHAGAGTMAAWVPRQLFPRVRFACRVPTSGGVAITVLAIPHRVAFPSVGFPPATGGSWSGPVAAGRTVTGTVFRDTDLDNALDGGEVALPNRVVYIGVSGVGTQRTAANGVGGYSVFAPVGSTVSVQAEPTGTDETCPAAPAFVVPAGSGAVAGSNVAVQRPATVRGLLYRDRDRDGVRDPSPADAALPSRTLTFTCVSGGWPAVTATTASGTGMSAATQNYSVRLRPGTWRLTASLPAGVTPPAGVTYVEFTVADADLDDIDFPAWETTFAVSGQVTAGGSPAAGVVVRLAGADGTTRDETTDSLGGYAFAAVVSNVHYTLAVPTGGTPAYRSFTALSANQTGQDFTI